MIGIAEGVRPILLLAYMVLLPVLVFQIALPTIAGWAIAFSGWLIFCFMVVFVDRHRWHSRDTWLILALVALSVPLYLLRPGNKRVGQGPRKARTGGD
jgi:uncharacterized membrane protein YhaH (DUF805 family)